MKIFLSLLCIVALAGALPQYQYNQTVAVNIVYYAIAAHCSDSSISTWTCGLPCQEHPDMQNVQVIYNKSHHAQGFTGYDPTTNSIVASFRGTVDDVNTFFDLDFIKVQYPLCSDCKVHQGFYKTYLDLQEDVLKTVKYLKLSLYPNANIVVTGHSLGGALATFAALDIQTQIGHVNMLQTYGCPRVGNQEFANFVDTTIQTYYRIVHYKDPVPHLPFREMGFWHPAYEVWYFDQNNTEYRVCNSSGEDKSCSDSIKTWEPKDHDDYLNVTMNC